MISEEESERVRQALMSQVDSMNLPDEEKDHAVEKISNMSPEQLEKFIKPQGNCIFCSIAKGQVDSFKIAENSDAVVVLEINPLSKGHAILIPKAHSSLSDLSLKSYELLQVVIKNIKSKLNPKEISISSSENNGHIIINILPLSGNETGKREKATEEQLKELQNLLKTEAKKPEVRQEIKIQQAPPLPQQAKPKEKSKEPEIIIEKAPVRMP